MRLVVQRVREASVRVGGDVVGRIGPGLLVFLGIGQKDGEADIEYLAEKLLELRIFPDENQRMNLSLRQKGGDLLVVSQFTLYGDCRKGRRPSFDDAMEPVKAEALYRRWVEVLGEKGFPPRQGVFGALMEVQLVNDGPVTLLLDSSRAF